MMGSDLKQGQGQDSQGRGKGLPMAQVWGLGKGLHRGQSHGGVGKIILDQVSRDENWPAPKCLR